MPTVRVETNLNADFFHNDFMPLFLIFLAELLGKDKNIMKFVFDTDKNMTIVSKLIILRDMLPVSTYVYYTSEMRDECST